MNTLTKKILTHASFVISMLVVACIYFSPVLSGKVIRQGDIQKADAMAYEQRQVEQSTGEIPNWNSSMFSGMPGYQTAAEPQKSIFTPLKSILIMRPLGAERHIGILFLYLIGFYVALLAFGGSPWMALLGALAFGLGSYNIIIIEAGHITKAWAMAMMAPILAGMVLTFKGATLRSEDPKKGMGMMIWGGILFTLALGLQITFNHIQITFYTAMAGVIMGIVYLIYSLKDKWIMHFLLGVGVLLLGCVFAFAGNARHLLVNQEYAKQTMRGGSEISNSKGLDQDYAFSWSYGIGETYTILVPGAYGGASTEKMGRETECYKNFHQDRFPLYWGDQPFTSGPVYFGAIVILLFVLGLIVVKGPERWWILIATLLAILMSWGRNLPGFNSFLFDHMPLYNKFRTPSMSLVLANVGMIILGVLALKEIFTNKTRNFTKPILISGGITGGIIIIAMVLSSGFSYSGASDVQMANAYGNQWEYISNALIQDRASLFMKDSIRSLIFVALTAAILWLYAAGKLKNSTLTTGLITLLIFFDLWGVDARYLSKDNFVGKHDIEISRDAWDYDIDQQAAQFGDKDFRVLNLAVNTFNDSKPSAFHHQIGGYSAAKLRRYQDLIDYNFNGKINFSVLQMLNTRYIVGQDGKATRMPVPGMLEDGSIGQMYEPMGNAWFVKEYEFLATPIEELQAISKESFKPGQTAYIDQCWKDKLGNFAPTADSTATIEMVHEDIYNPDHLTYKSSCASDQLAVFSEIYYEPDWRVYIDGEKADYFRADYVLRAMIIPAGNHTIEFVNEAPSFHKWDTLTLVSSIVLILVIGGALFLYYRKPMKSTKE